MGAERPAQPGSAAATPPSAQNPFWVGSSVQLKLGRVNYMLGGPPAPAPLVVCAHGLNSSLAAFELMAPTLVGAGFRLLTYDLYGFGLSARPKGGRLDLGTLVEQLRLLLDSVVGPEPVYLVGYSMGGVVVSAFARHFPQRVKRLLLLAPAGYLQREETPCRPFVFGCLRRMWGGAIVACVGAFGCMCGWPGRRWLLGRKTPMIELDARERERFVDYEWRNTERFAWNLGKSLRSWFSALRHLPLWEEDFCACSAKLAKCSVSILFVWGDEDNTVPWEESRKSVIATFAPLGASCIVIPAGHALIIEQATQVAQLAVAWFHDVKDPAWLNCLEQWKLSGPAHQNVSEMLPGAEVVGAVSAS